MEDETGGCRVCAHRYTLHGDSKCDYQPHDMLSTTAKAIVVWLSHPLRDAHNDPGCPGFEHFRAALEPRK